MTATNLDDPPETTSKGARAGTIKSVAMGVGGGLLGGISCLLPAIATGAGLAGLAAARHLDARLRPFQPYLIVAGLVLMALWLFRTWRVLRAGGRRAAGRLLVRQALVGGAVYGAVLGAAFMAAALARTLS